MDDSPGGGVAQALLTDLYELTMAYGYWKQGLAEREAVFHAAFRTLPFSGGYAVAAGLGPVIEYLRSFRFSSSDLRYLGGLKGDNGQPLFSGGFIEYLGTWRLRLDVDAMPEGTLVFPHEPLIRIRGPLAQAQLVETALLNLINFQTLIATKTARICVAAQGDPVIEFGLRRAQGVDGALAASRAAYIGGCHGTSNVLAGERFGIPVKGTHAHSWVMAFADEPTAFRAYAEAMPNNCVLLVDTYDTLAAVHEAVRVGRWLREQGHELGGVRLDSGDLAYLSIEARRILDEGGFPNAAILGSNDLDEHVITSLKQQGARINVWGVGTKLVTAYDQPALGGVYKLTALRSADGSRWEPKMKLSEQPAKLSIPGMLNVRRYQERGVFAADMIYDELVPPAADGRLEIVDPGNELRRKALPRGATTSDLLQPVFRAGECVYAAPSLAESRAHTLNQLAHVHPGTKRLLNPHEYPAGLEGGLHDRRTAMALELRRQVGPK